MAAHQRTQTYATLIANTRPTTARLYVQSSSGNLRLEKNKFFALRENYALTGVPLHTRLVLLWVSFVFFNFRYFLIAGRQISSFH